MLIAYYRYMKLTELPDYLKDAVQAVTDAKTRYDEESAKSQFSDAADDAGRDLDTAHTELGCWIHGHLTGKW